MDLSIRIYTVDGVHVNSFWRPGYTAGVQAHSYVGHYKFRDSVYTHNAIQLVHLLSERQICAQEYETYSHELHLQYIYEVFGPFPPDFLKDCDDRDKYFDDNGELSSHY